MYTKHVSRSYTSILNLLRAHLKENILVSSFLFIFTAGRVRARAITKTRLGVATWTMVTVAPFQVPHNAKRKGETRKRWCLTLVGGAAVNDSSPRANQRRRMSFCAAIIACVLIVPPPFRKSVETDRGGTCIHDDDGGGDGGGDDGEPAQGRPVARFSKILYSQRTDIRLMHSWEYPVDGWYSQVKGMRSNTSLDLDIGVIAWK